MTQTQWSPFDIFVAEQLTALAEQNRYVQGLRAELAARDGHLTSADLARKERLLRLGEEALAAQVEQVRELVGRRAAAQSTTPTEVPNA